MGGAFTRRNNADVEEVDITTHNAYRYPPKSGCYFGSHFIMGGERFETTQPETYLFGENQDLNFLGHRPVPFPYPAPQAHEPTKTLKSLVNIRKDSLRLIKVQKDEGDEQPAEPGDQDTPADDVSYSYNLEFTFDTDVRVAITIYYFATEEINNGQAMYHPRDPTMNSETYRYKRGANQTFAQSTHIIEPKKFPEEEWQYNPDKEVIPVVIQCVVEDEAEHDGHSHMTFAIVEKALDGGYCIKALKQKQMVDGLCYLLQEIYGIENKTAERAKLIDDEIEDTGSECVICMCETRDTLILPCRHLCLCNTCADNLRYQANNCPICRAPFRALLQIRAMRKKLPILPQPGAQPPQADSSDENVSQEGVPQGYEAVSLIKALNGSTSSSAPTNPLLPPPDAVGRMGTPASLPTSPEESPVLSKRKHKRQSSSRTHRVATAARQEPVIEETKVAKDVEAVLPETNPTQDGNLTPQTEEQTQAKQGGKSSPKSPKKAMPKLKYPAGKLALVCNPLYDSLPTGEDPSTLHIINEQADPEPISAVATIVSPQALTTVTPPPDYEPTGERDGKPSDTEAADIEADHDNDDDVPAGAEASTNLKAAVTHTSVLYDDCKPRAESEPLDVPNLSLPGTPSNTDGSSFDSNASANSNKALLSSPRPGEDGKPLA